ncbi:MAG: hypothetical protein IPL27_11680 [Lewinellaceae bacterium]|nr:hypothetical protein [Lewinellaceae bacterium]
MQSFPDFNSLNISDNPMLKDAGLESQAMRAAAAKAQVLLKKNDPALRLNAAHCFDLSFGIAARLRRTYSNDFDKFALASGIRELYAAAALNLWQLWQETGNTEHLTRLFVFFEQTKAQALSDALRQQRALALTGIPDMLLAREESLRLDAADAVNGFKENELSGGDTSTISKRKAHAFQQEKAYADFLKDLENNTPSSGNICRPD